MTPTRDGAKNAPAHAQAQALAPQGVDWRPAPPRDFGELAQEGFPLAVHEFFRVLRRYKWVVLTMLAAAMAIGAVSTLLTTRMYTASTRLEIANSPSQVVQKGEVAPAETRDFEFLRTQYELLQSRNIVERAVATLKLADDPELGKPRADSGFSRIVKVFWPAAPAKPLDRAAVERGVAGAIVANRVIKPVPGSRLIDISYTDANPARARAVTMGLANEFISSIRDKRFEATAYAKTFLEDQVQQLRAKLQESENVLIEYSQKEQIIATANDKISIAEANLAAANATLGNIVTERLRNEQQYHQIENATGANLPQFLNNKLIEALRERRNALVIESQEKGQMLRAEYPAMMQINNKIKETDKQIADEIRVIKTSLKGAYEASVKQEDDARKRVDELRSQVIELQKRSIHFNILKREADSNRAIYEDLLQRYKEVDVAGGVATSNVFIVDPAETPTSPSSPNLSRNLMVSMIIGLVAGLAGAFLLERLDNTVSKIDEFERVSGLPSLGVIPVIPGGSTLQEEMNNTSSDLWEAYRALCTSLQFATDKGLPRSLFFTSAIPGEGKSTSSLAVARYFGNLGLRVLLVDCDLRRPALHKRLGLSNERGLTNYLTGAMAAPDVWQSTPFANLTFLATGPLPPNASELLASPKFLILMSMATADFDLVIVDGPPIMGLADAQLLSKATQATIFTVRAGHTAKHSIRAALKRLYSARCFVIGGVLTRYEPKNETQSYEYGYAYGVDSSYDDGAAAPKAAGGFLGGIRALVSR